MELSFNSKKEFRLKSENSFFYRENLQEQKNMRFAHILLILISNRRFLFVKLIRKLVFTEESNLEH